MSADLAAGIVSSAWAYPALEVVHLSGVALLVGNLVLLEIRVFGWGGGLPVRDLARLALTLAVVGFGLAAVSGLLMFFTQAAELIANRAFTCKMLLLMLAACNAGWFHGRASLDKLDALARVQMVLSTLIWLAVLGCGRWIAYV
ncbi:hypothetical protein ACLBKS_12495 [Hylemonella sp. W303a]|uniref:hypothetical protein n=1 Tax=Hylemonella sp. W303a TaxID=3389873 RepID=UPI00396AF2D4